jgi:uncharacterized protein involved in exopolysaccharide biosynthesis/Mrp family chromosome partitioning ATPase
MANSIIRDTAVRRASPLPLSARRQSYSLRSAPPEVAESSAAGEVLVTLSRRKWLILGVALAGGVAAGLAGKARSPLYSATTQIMVDPIAVVTRAGAANLPPGALDAVIDDHLTALTSDANLRAVLATLPKESGHAASPRSISSDLETSIASLFGGAGLGRARSGKTDSSDDGMELAALKKGLSVGQDLRSTIVTIGFMDRNPARAAKIANAVAGVYIDRLTNENRAADAADLGSVVARLPEMRRELASATDQLEAYRLTHGAADQEGGDETAQDVAQLNRDLSLAKARLSAAEARLQGVRTLRKSGAPAALLMQEIVSSAPMSSTIAGDPATNGGTSAAGAADPSVTSADVDQGVARLQSEADAYRAQMNLLQERGATLDAAASDAVNRQSGVRALELQVGVMSQLYGALLTRQQDLELRVASPEAGVAILSPAWPPTKPVTLPPIFLVPPGMVTFGLLAAVFVLAQRRFDRTLRSEHEVETALGVPCFGLLPKLAASRPRRLARLLLEEPKDPYARATASLLVSLAPLSAPFHPPGVVLVTSSLRDEGKTTLAWSLALTAARFGERTLLLDLDQQDGRTMREFCEKFDAVPTSRTLADLIAGDCAVAEAASDIPQLGLAAMVAPPASRDLLSLVSRIDATELIDQLRDVYDVVIINGPVGLDGPEASLLAPWADVVLFAVRWGKTPRNLARQAVNLMQGADGRARGSHGAPIGGVLTRVDLKRHVHYRFEDGGELLRANV